MPSTWLTVSFATRTGPTAAMTRPAWPVFASIVFGDFHDDGGAASRSRTTTSTVTSRRPTVPVAVSRPAGHPAVPCTQSWSPPTHSGAPGVQSPGRGRGRSRPPSSRGPRRSRPTRHHVTAAPSLRQIPGGAAPDTGQMLYRVSEAAQKLAISRSKMWELLARGEIESVKIDGARRVTPAALDAYVQRLRPGQAADAASA